VKVERAQWHAVPYTAVYGSVLLHLIWARQLTSPWLVAAAFALAVAAVFGLRLGMRSALRAALIVQVLALASAWFTLQTFRRIESQGPTLVAARQDVLADRLQRRLSTLVARGQAAAAAAARVAEEQQGEALFERLDEVRARTRVDALMIVESAGELVAWAGDHRGKIPDRVREGAGRMHYAERPLFSYLYFAAPVAGSARAVAAVLVETGLVEAQRETGASLTFAARGEERATFRAGPGHGEDVAWSLMEDRDTVVHARLQRVTQAELRQSAETAGRRAGLGLALVALVILAAGWMSDLSATRRATVPLLAAVPAFAVAPFDAVPGLEPLYSPSLFVLPLPFDPSLGAFLAALVPIAALVATFRPPVLDGRAYRLAITAGGLAVVLAYPALLRLLIDAATPSLLEGGVVLWYGLQVAAVLALAIITAIALPRRVRQDPQARPPRWRTGALLGGVALLVCTLLAIFTVVRLDPWQARSPWTAVLWIVPFLIAAFSFANYRGRSGILVRWLVAGGLAATAVLPHLWVAHVNARLNAVEREVATLGTELPAVVEFLLVGFGREVLFREEAGEDGFQLLYRSWVASGLAREPYGALITLWSAADEPIDELDLGGAERVGAQPTIVSDLVRQARNDVGPRVTPVTGVPGMTRVLTVPLGDGRVVSVAVPPRRTLERTGVVAPFLGVTSGVGADLNLIEMPAGHEVPEAVRWMRARSGSVWQSDARVRFPDGDYHAHTDVTFPGIGILLARGALLLALDVGVLGLLWLLGSLGRGAAPVARGTIPRLVGSFRTRVTVALFAFFLLPTALFGWVAYGAFALEVERAAGTVAAHAVRQAAQVTSNDLRLMADRAGAEVLYYLNSGELLEASSVEALALGIYSAWMSPEIFLSLQSGEATEAGEVRRLGNQSYLMAFRALRPAGILAVPAVLSLGETARRQQELAHLVMFALLLGAIFSLTLSVAVGRALAGPIGRLRRAATAVGSGHLGVRLPEPAGDEFGQLYASFNRMVRRLRRARTQERRTARVLAWGEVARQVAHEIKNPLTPIKLSVQHLRRAYRVHDPSFGRVLDENAEQILSEIDRLTEIARAFSRYGAPTETAGPLEAVDVATVVHEALTLYRAGDDTVRYSEDVDPDLPRAVARTGELKEVVLNLVENARDALDGTGSITVGARQESGSIALEVRDDGPGMPADVLERMFEPHFSTRTTGTGLGLAIVRRLVEGWGGDVSAQSTQGRGTVVRVRIQPALGPQRRR
jgi:signal transduction histidine kinase